ncbi:hypothetical protein NL676_017202 [Syzygium grande]|nr:hypothetical protein NL676_017202 [Syzygium grande]
MMRSLDTNSCGLGQHGAFAVCVDWTPESIGFEDVSGACGLAWRARGRDSVCSESCWGGPKWSRRGARAAAGPKAFSRSPERKTIGLVGPSCRSATRTFGRC